ncbi:MAG: diguanylate cyclase [Myxococcaceae bacterium]
MGIRGQLTLLIPGLVACGLVTIAFLAAEQQRREELVDMRVRNQQLQEGLGITAAMFISQNDMSSLDNLVAHVTSVERDDKLLELAVVDEHGRVLAHSEPTRFNQVMDDPFTRSALASDRPVWVRDDQTLRLAVPSQSGIRWATVIATYSLDRLEAKVARTRYEWLMFALGLWMVISAILYFGVDRLVVAPVRSLQAAVRKMGEGSLNTRAPPLRGREMSDLSSMFNKMAETLQAERDNLERAVQERTKELQDANARLERLAVTDGLTGLYNHRRFQEGLSSELLRSGRTNRPLAVLMADVDLFKKVNDALGHPAGDDLLRRLGAVLLANTRQTDLLARYGGEEFSVLLPETSKAEALQVAERMRAAVETELNRDTQWPQKITISLGVAAFPEDGKSGETVLLAADQALYLAKRQGRNRVIAA